jgi:hypothetical protein
MLTTYIAEYDGHKIPVVPRNRDISNAQESGMDIIWFKNEALHKVKDNPNSKKPRLICTWSDGENGGWFRRMDESSGFWGHFYTPFIDLARSEGSITPVKISDFLKMHPPKEKCTIKSGAWNVGSTSGEDFSQWNGSELQKAGVKEIAEVSKLYWKLEKKLSDSRKEELQQKLRQARQQILEAETSCFLFWGDNWVPKLYNRTKPAKNLLDEIQNSL